MAAVQEVLKTNCVNRFVGPVPQETKDSLMLAMDRHFANPQTSVNLTTERSIARPLTPVERQLVDLANQVTNQLLDALDLPPFNITPDHAFIIPRHPMGESIGGDSQHLTQRLTIVNPESSLDCLHISIHEMLHLKGWGEYALWESRGSLRVRANRRGYSILDNSDKRDKFNWFSEAVTEDIAKQCFLKVVSDPLVKAEFEATKAVLNENLLRQGIQPGDFLSYDSYAVKWLDQATNQARASYFSYRRQRGAMSNLFNKAFKGDEQVYQEFRLELYKDYFRERTPSIVELLDGRFGGGTYDSLVEVGDDMDKVEAFVEAL